MLALKIIGGIVGTIGVLCAVMFAFFFVQAIDEIHNCKLLSRYPDKAAYQCPDGTVHWQQFR